MYFRRNLVLCCTYLWRRIVVFRYLFISSVAIYNSHVPILIQEWQFFKDIPIFHWYILVHTIGLSFFLTFSYCNFQKGTFYLGPQVLKLHHSYEKLVGNFRWNRKSKRAIRCPQKTSPIIFYFLTSLSNESHTLFHDVT